MDRPKLDDAFMCNDTVPKADIHFCQKPMESGLNTLEDCLFPLLDTQAVNSVLQYVLHWYPYVLPICIKYMYLVYLDKYSIQLYIEHK